MNEKRLLLNRISDSLIIGVPILAFLYLLWFLISRDLYFTSRPTISCVFGIAVLIGMVLYLPAFIFTRIRLAYRISLFALLIISFCFSSMGALYNPTIQNTAHTMSYHTYHLIAYNQFDDTKMMHYLVQCYQDSIFCKTVSPIFNVSGASIWPTQLLVDDTNNELHVFIRGIWVYTYGGTSRSYTDEGTDLIGETFYDLYSYSLENSKHYRMATCNRETKVDCQILPFAHTTSRDVYGDVVSAADTGELWILFNGKVTYSYLNKLQNYELIEEAWSENRLSSPPISKDKRYNGEFFTVYVVKDADSFRYLLFACHNERRFCRLLPFRYKTINLENARLTLNTEQTQLQLYLNEQLIYTYSQWHNSACWVPGCLLYEE